jgi:hypothetical protein
VSTKNSSKHSIITDLNGNELNDHFVSVASQLVENDSNLKEVIDSNEVISPVMEPYEIPEVNNDIVLEILKDLPNKQSTGHDNISLKMIKSVIWILLPHIVALINIIVNTSIFPNCWKISKVIPIYKGSGVKNDPNNFRPISLLSVMSKIFGRHVHKTLNDYLNKNKLLSHNQFGFREKSSTVDALLNIQKEIIELRRKGFYVCVVTLDLRKAFDLVNRKLLIKKLKKYGIGPKALKFFESYFENRKKICSQSFKGNVHS